MKLKTSLCALTLALAACGGDSDTQNTASSSSSSASSSSSSSSASSSSSSSSSTGSVVPPAPSQTNVAPPAKVSTSYVSPWETLTAVNDGATPANSNDKDNGAYGNWDSADTLQWVQYEWSEIYDLSGLDIYWFDDGAGVLTPTSAYVEYWLNDNWVNAGNVPTQTNQFNPHDLDVSTHRLRVLMRNTGASTGILEWRVYGQSTGQAAPEPTITAGQVPYPAVENEYVHLDMTTSNTLYTDSDRFRAYYGGNGLNGGQGNAAEVPTALIDQGLEHLEAAYECLVNRWGFRSASLPLNQDQGPYYKLNVYSTTTLNAGGAMGANGPAGLSFFELKDNAIQSPRIIVHEYGHCLNYSGQNWNGQNSTGAWWESVANFFTDSYFTDPVCEEVRVSRGMQKDMDTIVNLDVNIALSYLTIVHTRNYYQAWPFLTYISQNPDGYPGLGRLVLKDMFDNHPRNDETPLHVLQRLTTVPVQTIIGRYWARMAFLDINHPKAQARYFSALNDGGFRQRAFANLDDLGGGKYRVKQDKQPQYAGANITPLNVTANQVSISITNLGNGLDGSNFTATLSVRNTSNGQIRYVDLPNGQGSTAIAASEEVSLVVANTPDALIQFNAFESSETTPDYIGLNYEVQIDGAIPAN